MRTVGKDCEVERFVGYSLQAVGEIRAELKESIIRKMDCFSLTVVKTLLSLMRFFAVMISIQKAKLKCMF